jgi:PAS domain S-box-containing protein
MIFLSEGCYNLTGYTGDQFLGNGNLLFNDMIVEEYRDKVIQKWEKVMAEGETFEGEYPIITASGETRWVWERCRGEYNEAGEILYIEGYIEDVTERQKAVESLRESEQRYVTFINSIDDFAFLKDENFKYLFINNANATFFGKSAGEAIGLDDFDLMQPEYAQTCRNADLQAIHGTGVMVTEEIVDGRTFESRKFPVQLKNGKMGVGGYIRDISDRKAAELEISRMHDELEQRVLDRTAQLQAANKELEAFSYSVSHDLRAPLRAVDGFTMILVDEYAPKLDVEGVRLCNVIRENAVRMGQLIDDLLALSRFNRTDMHMISINMESLATAVFIEGTSDAEKERTEFKANGVHRTHGDRVLIKQVLVNLISNAVKFSAKRNPAVITFTSKIEGSMVVYSVKDNGAGFDMKYIDKLFGAFQRLHSVKEFEGNGIGLAIVQRIIHRHGGKVWAEGEVGRGASFYFSLPLANNSVEG